MSLLRSIGTMLLRQLLEAEVVDGPKSATSSVKRLPLETWGFHNCPAIPYWADAYGDPSLPHILATVGKLQTRGAEATPTAYHGLSTTYTIDDQTNVAFEFLYGEPLPGGPPGTAQPAASAPLTKLPLDNQADFTLGWTTYGNMYADAQDVVEPFAETLETHEAASAAFWPTIASFGIGYNLLVLSKVDPVRAEDLERELGDVWHAEGMGDLLADGLLYEIDMTILGLLEPTTWLDGTTRFTPGTRTLLKQDPQSKALTPVSITVSSRDRQPVVYRNGCPAWLYALQAAKTSVTVWGIWLGHVYHWHIVTAAMQMTMYNELPAGHRLYELMQPQSQSLIDFDYVLLTLLWGQISPPTPVDGSLSLLPLLDRFAAKRVFHDDDPLVELKRRGIDEADFTVDDPWDAYPIVGHLLEIWGATGDFVTGVVDGLYKSDKEVADDEPLQAWMKASADPKDGNVKGLPAAIGTRPELASVLTSLLYRITAHGAGSLNPSVNPVLTWVANFPPCLQSDTIPKPTDAVSPADVLALLPLTGTIGGMTTFYFTFAYSTPYARLIPDGGPTADQYFTEKSCNDVLVAYRTRIGKFVTDYTNDWNDAIGRISGKPGAVPGYAANQAGQWPRSIEI
jgi:hypothetical protein